MRRTIVVSMLGRVSAPANPPNPRSVSEAELVRVITAQDGVINRRQALATGLTDVDLRRLVRRREWAAVHRGVYVNHTGPLTWRQRAWAACLAAWPAALSHESALRAADGPGGEVPTTTSSTWPSRRSPSPRARRRPRPRPRVVRTRVQWNPSPPRVRIEEAVLDLAAAPRRHGGDRRSGRRRRFAAHHAPRLSGARTAGCGSPARAPPGRADRRRQRAPTPRSSTPS